MKMALKRLWILTLLSIIVTLPMHSSSIMSNDSISSQHLKVLLHKGDSCEQNFDTYHALQFYTEALDKNPVPYTIRKVAYCYFKRGQFSQCINLINRIPTDSIKHQDLKLKYNTFYNAGIMDSTLKIGKIILSKYPYDSEIVTRMAFYYNEHNQPDSAIAITTAYQKKDSTNIYVNRQLANAFYQAEKYRKAIRTYKSLLQANDTTSNNHYFLGMCYNKCDSIFEAFDHLQKAAQLNEYKNPYILSQLGVICVEIGKNKEGIDFINQAIEQLKISDNLMFTFMNTMASAYIKERDYKNTLKCLLNSLNYHSSPIYVYYKIAQTYGYMHNDSKEREYYQLFIDKAEKKEEISNSLAGLIEQAKKRVKEIREEQFFKGKTDEK